MGRTRGWKITVLGYARPVIRRQTLLLVAMLAVLSSLPAAATAAPDPFYGTLFDDNPDLTREQRQQDMARQAEAGIGTIRHHFFWSQVETEWTTQGATGVYDWNALDKMVADAADAGLRILPVVFSTPAFYRPAGVPADRQSPPEDSAYLGRFLRKLAERYGPNGSFWCSGVPQTCRDKVLPIRAWEVWNEPNYPSWWKGASEPDPAEYVELLRDAYLNLKVVDPGAEVVMAGLAPVVKTTPSLQDYRVWLEAFYDAGGAAWFDTLGMHAYNPTVQGVMDIARTVRSIADSHGDTRKPLWITEWGWATGGTGSFVATRDCQAALVHAAATEFRTQRDALTLRGAVQFQWRDVATTKTAWPFYAGLNPPGYSDPPKPALRQYARAIAGLPPDPGYDVATGCAPEPPDDEDPPSDTDPPPDDTEPPDGGTPPSGQEPPATGTASETSQPAPDLTPSPVVAEDRTPPKPRIRAASIRNGRLIVTLGCGDEPCTAIVSASLRLPGRPAFRLKGTTAGIGANETVTLRFKPTAKARRALALTLRQPKLRTRIRARIAVRATDAAGNAATHRKTVAPASG